MELPKRKPTRLKNYDYTSKGAYFITICTKDRMELLSKILVGQGLAPAEYKLTKYGKIAKSQIELLKERYTTIRIDNYVIMPNHIHLLISVPNDSAGASPCPTISDVICTFKSCTTIECRRNGLFFKSLFQSSFYDHIIRDDADYQKIWQYIDTNVARWEEDKLYTKRSQ